MSNMIRFRKWMKISLSLICLFSMVYPAFPGITLASTGCSSNFTTSPMVSAGDNHSLFLRNDGTVWAWGQNNFGQLGNGTTSDRSPPVQVTGLCDVVAIAAGVGTSMALKEDGTVWAWGNNIFGQLGDGTTNSSAVLVQVSGMEHVAAIAAGGYYALALKQDGTVWSWGYNSSGQLGYDTTDSNHSVIPQQISGLSDITSISAGFNHAAAVSDTDDVWTWGDNSNGQLGRTTSTNSYNARPEQVPGLTHVRSVSLGLHFSVALLKDGTVWAWGVNGVGQLGNGTRTSSPSPVQVKISSTGELTHAVAIEAGYEHTIALLDDGSVQSWGSNARSQIGVGTDGGWHLFAVRSNLEGIAVSAAAGRAHSIIVKNNLTVWTWGNGEHGQLGNGRLDDHMPPALVPGLCYITAIAANSLYTVALRNDGTVWTWGDNLYGQLGNEAIPVGGQSSIPVQVTGLSDVKAIAAGANHVVALERDGTVWTWGFGGSGQLGYDLIGTNYSTIPGRVPGLSGVLSIAAGETFTAALTSDGTVWTWGGNQEKQLGYETGTPHYNSVPKQVPQLNHVESIAAGFRHMLAIKRDGTVWAWGGNSSGQLGNGKAGFNENSSVPVRVMTDQHVGLDKVASLAAGPFHSYAVPESGALWGWGYNYFGELGDGTFEVQYPLARRLLMKSVASLSTGSYHTLAIKKDGTVWSWGTLNDHYQLGRKSGSPSIELHVPGPVEGLGSLDVPSLIPYIPMNINLEGLLGGADSGWPVAIYGSPITVTAFYDNPRAIRVNLVVTDGDGDRYEAWMSATDEEGLNWSHTFIPKLHGLGSPLQIELTPVFLGDEVGNPIVFGVILIDPSGIIYNADEGDPDTWPLPGATVVLQTFDPDLGDWVEMNEYEDEGRFTPPVNPQVTGSDGRFAWDTAPGLYRVVVSRPGFEPAISRTVSVPPPVLDLHVGLIPTDHVAPGLTVSGVTYGETYTQPVLIEWYAYDDDPDNESHDSSGIRYVDVGLNDGDAVRYLDSTGSLQVHQTGTYTVQFTVVDHAGNRYVTSIPFAITEPSGEVENFYTVTFNSNGGSSVADEHDSPTGSVHDDGEGDEAGGVGDELERI